MSRSLNYGLWYGARYGAGCKSWNKPWLGYRLSHIDSIYYENRIGESFNNLENGKSLCRDRLKSFHTCCKCCCFRLCRKLSSRRIICLCDIPIVSKLVSVS